MGAQLLQDDVGWMDEDDELAPNIHSLFQHYNALYFGGALGACSVEWSSKRMTLCAGQCHFSRGGGARIVLSEPLLKLRPPRDLKDTLLHEMIHAQLFLSGTRDDDAHGSHFQAVMRRINAASCPDPARPPGGYNITVFHTMHDEVANYRTHVWECGRCGKTVRRAMNRPPQEADCRSYSKAAAAAAAAAVAAGGTGQYCADGRCGYHAHLRTCGGAYVKIQEPDNSNKAAAAAAAAGSTGSGGGAKRSKKKQLQQQQAPPAAASRPITAYFATTTKKQQQQQDGDDDEEQQVPGPPAAAAAAAGGDSGSGRGQFAAGRPREPPSGVDARAAAAAAAIARAAGLGGGGGDSGGALRQEQQQQQQQQQQQREEAVAATNEPPPARQQQLLLCPVCAAECDSLSALNAHLDDGGCLK